MASRLDDGKEVPSSVSVKTMNDSDVSEWTKILIGCSGGCITADSRRNLLQKYLQKQEAGASKEPLPLPSRVDNMSIEEVCTSLLSQIGSFAECKDEQSQRNMLKTYLNHKVKVPSALSVKPMSDGEVSEWTTILIGSIGGCTTADLKRNLLQKYLQRQEAGASAEPLPLSSRVDEMPLEQVSALLLNHIGSLAECKNEQSQRNLLKTYLLNKELQGRGESTDYTHQESNDLLDYEVEHGSDVLGEFSKMTLHEDNYRPEAKCLDTLNYVEVGKLLTDLGMDVTAADPEKDKFRLKQRLFSDQRDDSCGQKMRCMLDKKMEEYKDKKEKMISCCRDMITITRNESFKTEMRKATEDRFPRFENKLQAMQKFLQSLTDKFEIVCTGETSSGKSTFLNVLLGEHILPSHLLHTTACIFRLHNSMEGNIEYIGKHGSRQKISLEKGSSKLREQLKLMTNQFLENDAGDKPLQKIDVYWEIPSLHENVVLVDTPGIGETDALTQQVMQYVPNADGYIFVLDSIRAGGIQDGGIRKLIEMIAASTPKEEQGAKLGNICFVCNKWDLVERKYREDVMQNTKRKLSKFRLGLESWQVVEFNSSLELRLLEWKANASDAFSVLLKSSETLITRTIHQRLEKTYRWLLSFVMDVEGFMNARMQTARMTRETAEAQIHIVRKELEFASKELERCNEVQKMIDTNKERLLQELRKYLKTDEVQSKLLDWTNSVPGHNELKEKGPDLIKMRLQDAILEWASEENGPFKLASVTIRDKCMKIQDGLDVRIRAINKLELGLNLQESKDEYATEDDEKASVVIVLVALFAIAAFVLHIFRLWESTKDWVWSWFEEQAKKRRIEKMTEMTKGAIEELLTKDHLEKVINDSFTDPHSKWLTKFKKDTQRKISSIREVMLQMESDLKKRRGTITSLQPLHTELQKCYKCLKELEK